MCTFVFLFFIFLSFLFFFFFQKIIQNVKCQDQSFGIFDLYFEGYSYTCASKSGFSESRVYFLAVLVSTHTPHFYTLTSSRVSCLNISQNVTFYLKKKQSEVSKPPDWMCAYIWTFHFTPFTCEKTEVVMSNESVLIQVKSKQTS